MFFVVKKVEASELRKLLGIKKLKNKIQISEEEKAAIKKLREDDKRRVAHAEKLKV